MSITSIVVLGLLIFVAAMLYSSVGHAGASGYLAAMALMNVEPSVMRPTALTLNVLVSLIATWQFYRVGCFSWHLFWPFSVASVPAAYFGGAVDLPPSYYRPAVGVILLFAAVRLLFPRPRKTSEIVAPPLALALLAGAVIGFLSGLTGTGGGIFLSPLLLFLGWADARQSAGVSAAFILLNSIASLIGLGTGFESLPPALPLWAGAAILGGFIGAHYGSRSLANATLRRLLSLVLIVAGLKLIFST